MFILPQSFAFPTGILRNFAVTCFSHWNSDPKSLRIPPAVVFLIRILIKRHWEFHIVQFSTVICLSHWNSGQKFLITVIRFSDKNSDRKSLGIPLFSNFPWQSAFPIGFLIKSLFSLEFWAKFCKNLHHFGNLKECMHIVIWIVMKTCFTSN